MGQFGEFAIREFSQGIAFMDGGHAWACVEDIKGLLGQGQFGLRRERRCRKRKRAPFREARGLRYVKRQVFARRECVGVPRGRVRSPVL